MTATATRGSLTRKHLPRHHNPRHVMSPTTPHGKTDSCTGLLRPSPLPHRHAKRLRQAPLAYRLPHLRKTTATATHYVPTKPKNTHEPLHITTTGPTHAPTNVREPKNDHRHHHVTTWSPEHPKEPRDDAQTPATSPQQHHRAMLSHTTTADAAVEP
ncbi:hypothetical protein DXG01_004750 [Tephrocybe rancida]|nr:hypothetical protein DXG01_004750 [Tephrocybe rancida]